MHLDGSLMADLARRGSGDGRRDKADLWAARRHVNRQGFSPAQSRSAQRRLAHRRRAPGPRHRRQV